MKANQLHVRYRAASDNILITKEVPGENILAWDFTGDAVNSVIQFVRGGHRPTKPSFVTKILRFFGVRHTHEAFVRTVQGINGADVRITVEHIL